MSEYFVRHGQTDWNLEHKVQGSIDIELNESGRKQALKMQEKLKDVHFDVIFCSPLVRAKETAEIISESHKNTPLIVSDELRERNFGEYEGKHKNDDYYGLWQYDNQNTPNGETPKELEARIYPFLDKIRNKYKDGNVLLVAHGGVGLIIETYYKGVPESKDLLEYESANGELKIYDIDNTTDRIK